ncbi:MAG: energy transducer TonB family protein [Alphaproteobacteria bacterium]
MFGSPSLVWRPVGFVSTTVVVSSSILLASALAYAIAYKPQETQIVSLQADALIQSEITPASLSHSLPVPALIRPANRPTNAALSLVPLPRKPKIAASPVLAEITQATEPQDIGDLLNLLDQDTDTSEQIPESAIPEDTAQVQDQAQDQSDDVETNTAEPSLSEFLSALALDEIEVEQPSSNLDQTVPAQSPQVSEVVEDKQEASTLPKLQDLGLSKPKAAKQKIQKVFDLGIQVSDHAGAGDKFWNGRFPWTASTPVKAQNGEPVTNPLVVQNTTAVKQADSDVNDGSIPKSFILSAVSDLDTTTNPVDQSTPTTTTPKMEPSQDQPTPVIDQEALVADYGGEISNLIQQNIQYPDTLLPEKVTGTVELGLVFNTLGKITNVVIIKSSKNRIIDEGAVATVRGIAFPVPPEGATPNQLRFGIKMTYTPPASAS